MQDSNLHIPREWRFSRPLLYQLRQSSDFDEWICELTFKFVWKIRQYHMMRHRHQHRSVIVGFTCSPRYLTMDLPWIPPLLHVCTKWPTLIVFERNRRLELPRRPWKGRMLPLHQFRVTRPFTMYDYSQSNIFRCALVKYSLMF